MALSQANLETALNVTFTGTPDLPIFTKNNAVYITSEYDQDSGDNETFKYNPYKIVDIVLKIATDKVLDLASADADGSGTAAQKMWFYDLIGAEGGLSEGTDLRCIHQSLLKNLDDIKDFIEIEVNTWTDPS